MSIYEKIQILNEGVSQTLENDGVIGQGIGNIAVNQVECEDAADRRCNGLKNHATKLTFICCSLIIATVVSTLLYTWYFGRPIEAAMGIVPPNTKSMKQMVGDIDRLTAENNRLTSENRRLDAKNKQHRETKDAVMGLVLDDPRLLEMATKSNGFPFKDWHPYYAEHLLRMAVKANNKKALKWISDQQDWTSILSEATVRKVKRILDPLGEEELFGKMSRGGIPQKKHFRLPTDRRKRVEEQKERERLARLHPYWKKYAPAPVVAVELPAGD
jgi:hypothetical protein